MVATLPNRGVAHQRGLYLFRDLFDRPDDAASPGNNWIVATGTWGISSGKAYAVTDAADNRMAQTAPRALRRFNLAATVSGTMASATDYRYPVLVFRILQANANSMAVWCNNGQANIGVVAGAAFTSRANAAFVAVDGTDYAWEVRCREGLCEFWIDGVRIVSHSYSDTDIASYMGARRFGLWLKKSGAPATACRWNDIEMREVR